MAVFGNGSNVAVQIGIEMLPSLTMVNTSGDDVPQVWDNAGADEKLPFCIVINTPGIAETVGNYFKFVFDWVIAPNPSVDVHALCIEEVFRERIVVFINPAFAVRFAHFGGRSKALTTIQPTIRAPMQTI